MNVPLLSPGQDVLLLFSALASAILPIGALMRIGTVKQLCAARVRNRGRVAGRPRR